MAGHAHAYTHARRVIRSVNSKKKPRRENIRFFFGRLYLVSLGALSCCLSPTTLQNRAAKKFSQKGGGGHFFSRTLEHQMFPSSSRTSSTSDASCAESSSFRHAQPREDRRVEENKTRGPFGGALCCNGWICPAAPLREKTSRGEGAEGGRANARHALQVQNISTSPPALYFWLRTKQRCMCSGRKHLILNL